jgi:hypothetical protein
MIDWLESWYQNQCDSEWEHEYGIVIESLDNPGWRITIDLANTTIKTEEISWTLFEVSEENWVGFKIENNQFVGSGDARKLNFLIFIFKELTLHNKIDKNKVLTKIINASN